MSFFKRSSNYVCFMLLALCSAVYGHTYLSAVYLNNQLLNEGDCVRPHPSTAFDSPIPLVTSKEMTCGWEPASRPANRKCPISAGSSIGIQWHHNSNSPSDDIIEATHKGPVMVYLAKSDTGADNVWFKIYEDGLVNGVWGVDRLISNRGRLDVKIPSDLASGNYLLRGEVIALHSAYDLNGVQPYVGCVELTITSTGGNANPAGVALPGYYKNTDPGMLVNIYPFPATYTIPGPAVYVAGSSSSSSSGSSSSSSSGSSSTVTPTKAATSRPTSTPVTSAPVTSSPSDGNNNNNNNNNGGNIQFSVNGGSNIWWFAVSVSGGNEDTVKVEIADSGAVPNFYVMTKASYGWFFSQSIQLTLPISLRFTSASGKQVTVTKTVSSFTDSSMKNTNSNYGSSSPSTSAPVTSAPVTSKPVSTNAPSTGSSNTVKPTSAPPSGSKITVQQHPGASAWWFAVSVSDDSVTKVEIRDSGKVSSYTQFSATNWGYWIFSPPGSALVAPISIRVTSSSGAQSTATFGSISAGASVSL